MSVEEQLHDLKIKHDALEQESKIFQLQNTEYVQEIDKINKEKQDLKLSNDELTKINADMEHKNTIIRKILSSKSTAVESLQKQIDILQLELISKNIQMKSLKQQIDAITNQNLKYHITVKEFREKESNFDIEKENYMNRIKYLKNTIIELENKLPSMQNDDDNEYKTNVVHVGKSKELLPIAGQKTTLSIPFGLGKRFSIVSNQSDLSSQSFDTNVSYYPSNQFRKSGMYKPGGFDLTPLMDTPSDGSYCTSSGIQQLSDDLNTDLNEQFLGNDAITMHIRNNYELKINNLNLKNQKEKDELNEKIIKYEKEMNQLTIKLNNKKRTIKDLRVKNSLLTKKTEKKSCYAFDWFRH